MVEAPPWVTYYHHTRLFFGQLILLYRWMLNCSQASVHLCSMSWHQTGLSRGLESKLLLLVILNILSPLTCQSQPKRVNLPHSLTNIRLKDWHTESSWGLISSKSYNFRPRKFSKGSKDPILVIQSGQYVPEYETQKFLLTLMGWYYFRGYVCINRIMVFNIYMILP